MDNKKYCVFCGTENAENAAVCCKCKKTLSPKENGLKLFLLRYTKDKLKSDLTDKTSTLIKKFLLSHIYGILMTVLVVFAGASLIQGFALPSYVEAVNQRPAVLTSAETHPNESEITETQVMEATEPVMPFDEREMNNFLIEYLSAMETNDSETGLVLAEAPDYYATVAQGAHEFHTIPESAYAEIREVSHKLSPLRWQPDTVTSDLARQLLQDGYPVAETVISSSFTTADGSTNSFSFLVVAVKEADGWRIAADVMQ